MSAPAAAPPLPGTGARLRERTLAGTGSLLRAALRRDRIRLPLWLLGISAFAPYGHTVMQVANPDPRALAEYVRLMDTPMVALFTGPAFGLGQATVERAMVSSYFLEFLLAAGLMNILAVARHTRAEEQTGRAELVRAAPVGRQAPLSAALLLAAAADAVLAGLLAAFLGAAGYPAGSALLFGAAVGTTGLVFAGATALTAQLAALSRAAAGIAGAALLAAWAVRGIGALQQDGGSALTWLSPLAWAQYTRVLADERWWPLGLSVALAAALAAGGYALSERRDLGSGLLAERSGRGGAAPWLRSPLALAFRLQRTSILWWGGVLTVAAFVYGSLTGALAGADAADAFFGTGGNVQAGYLSLMAVAMGLLVCVYAVLAVVSLRTDEVRGRTALPLAGPTARSAWLRAWLAVTAAAGTAMAVAVGAAMAAGAAWSTGDASALGPVFAAAVVRIPEVLLVLSVAALLHGFAPRALPAVWAVVLYGGVVRFFAPSLGWPQWLMDLSPLDHIARMPVEPFSAGPVAATVAAAAALAGLAAYGYGRRDLAGG
ncbi:hypothetical protein O4J56_22920 [Nocardiopsis sp. RSe5-2]|uniref:ABC transporter permease n=1 Tax=Nocardiopsis endophytica TaxID=3018445 RepID=A0ABT4U993_9ACTN|nr:hypothetical protein [Nocardiopsis endophytica]MDA2813517.1 hypothetical protein [Nocardiopsis endophytica]